METWGLLPQCCDAESYQDIGNACARDGDCYDTLRPSGAVFWFSLPGRLGWPFESLLALHYLLLTLSVALSVWALFRLSDSVVAGKHAPWRWLWLGLLLVLSLVVHYWAFYPVFFHSLADAPAGLLATSGVWLLLPASVRSGAVWTWCFAGLFLGLAAWIRIFYLYPVLMAVLVFASLWLLRRDRRWSELLFLVALLPLLVQCLYTYKEKGYFSYIARYEAAEWQHLHLIDRAIGYDTVLPAAGVPAAAYRWYSDCSVEVGGIGGAWAARDYAGIACVLWQKTRFYLGSYMPHTYMAYPDTYTLDAAGNLLAHGEQFDKRPVWWNHQLQVTPDAALAPNGTRTADRIAMGQTHSYANLVHADGSGSLFQGFTPAVAGPYTFSIWLWSPVPKTLHLAFLRVDDNAFLVSEIVSLPPEPTRFQVTTELPGKGRFAVYLGAIEGQPTTFGTEESDFFYAWGAKLDAAPEALEYVPELDLGEQRIWSEGLLVVNLFLLLVALCWGIARCWRCDWPVLLAGLFTGLLLGQGLFVVPEQRFLIVFYTVVWLIAAWRLLLACLQGWKYLEHRR